MFPNSFSYNPSLTDYYFITIDYNNGMLFLLTKALSIQKLTEIQNKVTVTNEKFPIPSYKNWYFKF